MKLETRLYLLFGSLIAVFLGALGVLHATQKHSALELQREIANDKARQLEQVLVLSGSTLERFVADYTQWDDMCAFAAKQDPEWAVVNIEQSLESWDFHAAWVFGPDLREAYRNVRAPFAAGELRTFPSPALQAQLCGGDSLHFFAESPYGLLELRSAPIHPSDDKHLGERPRGWLLVARIWNTAFLAQLGALTDSVVTVAPGATGPADSAPAAIVTTRPLPGWDGQPSLGLVLSHTSPLLANMLEYDNNEVLLYLVFGISFLCLASWFVHRWVRYPLQLIEASLAQDRPELVAPLSRPDDEFARIGELIRTASAQRLSLRREIEDRAFAESELRRAIVERTTLGRDLHDGVIQSIYAVGMTLQGVGPLLQSDASEAQHRLDSCVEGLNRTIGQLRAHIAGLEQGLEPAASLHDGLQKLLQEMRPARPIEYDVRLDPLLTAALPPDSVVQLLYIAREAVSNALRHSGAAHIALRLDIANGEPVFLVEDDGAGFDSTITDRRGHGLDNMTRRAEEIGAALELESIPGRGTRLRIELPWATLNQDAPRPTTSTP